MGIPQDQEQIITQLREERDRNWKYFVGLCDALGKPSEYNVAIEEIKKLVTVEDALSERSKQLEEATKKIEDLQADLQKITTGHDTVVAENQSLVEEAQRQTGVIGRQEEKILIVSGQLETLKKECNLPIFSGWRKLIFDLLVK